MKLRSVGIVCLGLLLPSSIWAQEPSGQETCPHEKGWKPTDEALQRVLSDHQQWLGIIPGRSGSGGKANLCNADLSHADLNNANLSHADLNNANLSSADLNNAKLTYADLNNANLSSADLNNANLSSADLNNANLFDAKLNNAKLTYAELNNANMSFAELNNANLLYAKLNSADLSRAKLNNADLSRAKLNNANLFDAKLNNSYLDGAALNGAILTGTSVTGARLTMVDLTDATYAPASAPPDSYVVGIRGLSTVTFSAGAEAGLVQLRDLLQKAGLRDLEREAIFAIENGKTRHLFDKSERSPARVIEGVFRYVAFDLTTAYGLRPGQALLRIVGLWALLIPIYMWPIWRAKRPPNASGIYRIWPKDRIEVSEDQPTLDNPARVERLHSRGLPALGWSAYFSVLSTFRIGFREFSVGTWLTRTQPRNFALESTGWVRTASGIQSLLSVYLLAIWLLTYFGRPFQ